MFITLKPSKKSGTKEGRGRMEQLRCTGGEDACDRCAGQNIQCVASAPGQRRNRRRIATQSLAITPPISPAENTRPEDESLVGAMQSSPEDLQTQQPACDRTPESPVNHRQGSTQHPVITPLEDPAPDSSLSSRSVVPKNAPERGLQRSCSTSAGRASRQPVFNSSLDPNLFDPFPLEVSPRPEEASAAPDAILSTTSPKRSENACTCVQDCFDIIQKLDDDEFQLTSLAFDHVLKLQKYLIFHCCKLLDCPACVDNLGASTVTLVICERVTNMFECLCKRIEPGGVAAATLLGLEKDHKYCVHATASNMNFTSILKGPCNPQMFSPEFSAEYSLEEQMHMIRALAKVQAKTFNQFLVRLAEQKQSQRSQARLARIRYLKERSEEAAVLIDEFFAPSFITDVLGISPSSQLLSQDFAASGYTMLAIDRSNDDAMAVNEVTERSIAV
ncbi:hypothetical protein S40293_10986 [Stachybotrys chartarum IBT 40293]|nr:hypothetical protein S40293_10986 [Stachybotrys chartarum IBT 40293]